MDAAVALVPPGCQVRFVIEPNQLIPQTSPRRKPFGAYGGLVCRVNGVLAPGNATRRLPLGLRSCKGGGIGPRSGREGSPQGWRELIRPVGDGDDTAKPERVITSPLGRLPANLLDGGRRQL